eukprot:3010694-Rhodomonas_salina.1
MPMCDFLATIDWHSVGLTDEQRIISLVSSMVPSLHPPTRAQHCTDEENFDALVQLANDLFDIVGDCPAKNSLLLATFGLDPELQWWQAGIGEGLPEGHIDPQLSEEDMAYNYTDEMAEQVHTALLRLSPESRELEKLCHDDLHSYVEEELDLEPVQAEGEDMLKPLSPDSQELEKLCHDDLHSYVEEELDFESVQSEGEYMFKPLKYRLRELARDREWQTVQDHASDMIEKVEHSSLQTPAYDSEELERWTSHWHLDPATRAGIHQTRLQISTALAAMQPGRRRTMLEQSLDCMRNDITWARQEELRLARRRTSPLMSGVKIRRKQQRLRLNYPTSRIPTGTGARPERT